ncbi:hypothetical protein [Dactylosporangium sp. CA-139066]|uniref:hypothetical protein n=1 Tax=Dactylosporangium sp. CA-139066 TaxID=3239930 RepID=UPI003D9106E0
MWSRRPAGSVGAVISNRRKHQLAAMLCTAVIGLAGCSGKGAANAGASPTPSLSDAQIQAVVNELVQCIRENGAPGMPDVRVENGKVIQPDENSVDETTKQNAKSAMDACASIRDRLPPSVFQQGQANGGGPGPQDVPALRKFGECMRQNGVPEWPDPKADGSFPSGSVLETEGKSPRIVAGFEACRQYYDGGFRTSS